MTSGPSIRPANEARMHDWCRLYVLEGLTHREIGERAGLAGSTVQVALAKPEAQAFMDGLRAEHAELTRGKVRDLVDLSVQTIRETLTAKDENGDFVAPVYVRKDAALKVLEWTGFQRGVTFELSGLTPETNPRSAFLAWFSEVKSTSTVPTDPTPAYMIDEETPPDE